MFNTGRIRSQCWSKADKQLFQLKDMRYKPTLELAMKIAEKLNIRIEKLFYFEEIKN